MNRWDRSRQATIPDCEHEDEQVTDDQRQYVGYLNKQVQEYVEMREDMFGPRDQGFVFGTVRQSDCNIPRTYYRGKYHTDGGCVVDIKVGKSAWEKLQYGRSAMAGRPRMRASPSTLPNVTPPTFLKKDWQHGSNTNRNSTTRSLTSTLLDTQIGSHQSATVRQNGWLFSVRGSFRR